MKSKGILLFVFFHCFIQVHGQQFPQPPNQFWENKHDKHFIPASPNASELGKYGSIPVNHHTGIPDIRISLYNLKTYDFNLPIELLYHAGGIRVDDIAPWTGLGWSLNAGGVITVAVTGSSDIKKDYPGEEPCIPRLPPMTFYDIQSNNVTFTSEQLEWLSSSEILKCSDTEPDIYSFKFLSFSGQFVFDHNYEVRFLKNSNGLSITYDNDNKSFTAIDNAGNIYIFSIVEYTEQTHFQKGLQNTSILPYAPMQSITIPTAFYLDKIIIANSLDIILFEYTTDTIKYFTRDVGYIHTKHSNCDNLSGDDKITCILNLLNQGYNKDYYQLWEMAPETPYFTNAHVKIFQKRLLNISYKRNNTILCNIQFVSSAREDINGSKRLNTIIVRNVSQNELFRWSFNYDYFLSNVEKIEGHQYSFSTNNPLHKRLKLLTINKLYGNESISPPYTFSYYGDDISEQHLRLPPRNSYAGVDHWGFMNDDPNSSDVNNALKSFPLGETSYHEEHLSFSHSYLQGNIVPSMGSSLAFNLGSNKSVNSGYVMANSLKKINYPTGGYTFFEYESNTYSQIIDNTNVAENTPAGGLRIKRIIDYSNNSAESIVREFFYSGGVIFNMPEYVCRVFIYDAMNPIGIKHNLYLLHNSPINTLYSYGDILGYKKVSELSENGIIEYSYYTANDYSANICERFARINVITATPPHGQTDPYLMGKVSKYNYFPPVRPFARGYYGKSFKRGLLKSVRYLKPDSTLIKRESYEYDFIQEQQIFGNKFTYKDHWTAVKYEGIWSFWVGKAFYILNAYYHQTGKSFLSQKETELFDDYGLNPITNVTFYNYNTDHEVLISTIEEGCDNGQKTITTIYPFDYSEYSAPISQMVSQHMLNYPIETITSINGLVTEAVFNKYDFFGQIIKPVEVYKLEITEPLDDFTSSNQIGSGQIDPRYEIQAELSFSSDFGNLLEVKPTSNHNVAYLWGYNNSLLIAKTENAANSQVAYSSFEDEITAGGTNSQVLGNWKLKSGPSWYRTPTSIIGDFALGTNSGVSPIETTHTLPPGVYEIEFYSKGTTIQIPQAILENIKITYPHPSNNGYWYKYNAKIILDQAAKIEVKISNTIIDDLRLYPATAQMTSYTYKPLIGVSSITDPSGRTTYYEYDLFGRLKYIKNDEGHYVQKFDYHYREDD